MNTLRFLQALLAAMAFGLCAASPAHATPSASEQRVIETLIQRVASQKSMKFMRNGEEHDATEAAQHLRAKYDHFKDKIVTAEDFIRLCGTRSEVTKVPYKVRTADKRTRNSSDFLKDELRLVRRQAKA
ncbi:MULTISPECIES: DUF5329 family protein [unclassified Variovorax]|uniref:DUF5329 family protein n=1 Tax=unclassified Variovorax TaxID=663243 RepID=UPI0008882085|nr:DUF5329 family protein [Variovorax sp. CF079]SDC67087.1 hypothetical protein SAMN05444679_104268 [Variovorax sp. CF079]